MPTPIKSAREVERIAAAGALVDDILQQLAFSLRAGMTTREVDQLARALIARTPAQPVLEGYVPQSAKTPAPALPFPACCCVSAADDVVHGAPGERVIREQEPVTIDLVLSLDGWCADAAATVIPGAFPSSDSQPGEDPTPATRAGRIVRAARAALRGALAHVRPGVRWSDAARAGEQALAGLPFRLVHAYAGHGIGRTLHEPPRVPFASPDWTRAGEDFPLAEGLVLCVEPIVVEDAADGSGMPALFLRDDGWTVATRTGEWAAHEEVTIAVTHSGCRVLAGDLPCVRPINAATIGTPRAQG